MSIVLLCATQRGYRVLDRLLKSVRGEDLVVFSFPEEPWEPPYLQQIRDLATANRAAFYSARNVGGEKWKNFWAGHQTDLILAVNWRYIVPASVYLKARLGAYVFHDSPLPAYRGFSPTVWAIANGEDHTGATLLTMEEDVDTGDIIDQTVVPIGPADYVADVTERVTEAYLQLLDSNLEKLLSGEAQRRTQTHGTATYCCKRTPDDGRIDWSASAKEIFDLIRAVSRPYTGAFCFHKGCRVTVWKAKLAEIPPHVGAIPGRVLRVLPGEGVIVLAGRGGLLIQEVQREAEGTACAADLFKSITDTLS